MHEVEEAAAELLSGPDNHVRLPAVLFGSHLLPVLLCAGLPAAGAPPAAKQEVPVPGIDPRLVLRRVLAVGRWMRTCVRCTRSRARMRSRRPSRSRWLAASRGLLRSPRSRPPTAAYLGRWWPGREPRALAWPAWWHTWNLPSSISAGGVRVRAASYHAYTHLHCVSCNIQGLTPPSLARAPSLAAAQPVCVCVCSPGCHTLQLAPHAPLPGAGRQLPAARPAPALLLLDIWCAVLLGSTHCAPRRRSTRHR